MWDWFQRKRRGHILRRIERKVNWLMSSFDDLAAAQADTLTKVAAVKTDVETLLAQIKNIPPAGLTPEQQAALDQAVTTAQSINTALSAVDTEVHPPAA